MSATVVTPTARSRVRAARPLLILAIIVLTLIIIGSLVHTPTGKDSRLLAAQNYTDDGAAAVTNVLKDHGVNVQVPANAREAVSLGSKPDTTLVVVFPSEMSDDVAQAVQDVPRVLYIGTEWSFGSLDGAVAETTAGVAQLGLALRAQCDLPAAQKADAIADTVYGVQLSHGWTGCFPLESGLFAFAQKDTGNTLRTIITDSSIPRNSQVNKLGNAALVMNAIAPSTNVVWYTPQIDETLAEPIPLVPPQVMPLLFMMGVAALLLALAWGRRLGRLVPEDLPGYVPAAETITGRGRLLARGKDRAHAARSLRVAAAGRIAKARGISVHAAPEVLDSVDPHGVLRQPLPSNDKELLQLAHDLDTLEKDARP